MAQKRISIMIDVELDKKLRLKQAKLIQKTKTGVTFSSVINIVLSECLKNGKKK